MDVDSSECRLVQRKRWLKKDDQMLPWVFPSLTGIPVEERNLWHAFKCMPEKNGVRLLRIQGLRHATTMAAVSGRMALFFRQSTGSLRRNRSWSATQSR